jgi:hypothetical protein
MAGPVRFELTMGFPTPVFKTGAFNRSATDPLHYKTFEADAIDHAVRPFASCIFMPDAD